MYTADRCGDAKQRSSRDVHWVGMVVSAVVEQPHGVGPSCVRLVQLRMLFVMDGIHMSRYSS